MTSEPVTAVTISRRTESEIPSSNLCAYSGCELWHDDINLLWGSFYCFKLFFVLFIYYYYWLLLSINISISFISSGLTTASLESLQEAIKLVLGFATSNDQQVVYYVKIYENSGTSMIRSLGGCQWRPIRGRRSLHNCQRLFSRVYVTAVQGTHGIMFRQNLTNSSLT